MAGLLHVSIPCAGCKIALTLPAGFADEHALILYVYLPNDEGVDDSVLTVGHPAHRRLCALLTSVVLYLFV